MKEKTSWDIATEGTYTDMHVPPAFFIFVLALALVIVAVPSVGMLWARTDSTTENRELAETPSLHVENGSFNWNILADAGDYFADHFAFRNHLVSANARIHAILGTSPTDQVVIGLDGWLYYGGTLPDYLGQSALSDRALRNIAHNLALAQGYVESQGAAFTFVLAPNKNTLYPAHMPYYYLQASQPSNAERLRPLLEEGGVKYIDLFDMFGSSSQEWYLKKDSHWDSRGALMVTQEIFAALGRDALPLNVDESVPRTDFLGDLESMLYPIGAQPDQNWYFMGINDDEGMSGSSWTYAQGENVTDSWVVTSSKDGQGSVLMFRDSFGNSLLPFWASSYKQGVFSKLIPYNLPMLAECKADTVVIERAERHLSYLAEKPPIMPNPIVNFKVSLPKSENTDFATCDVTENGPYWVIAGMVDESAVTDTSRLFVSVELDGQDDAVFDAFWTSVLESDNNDEMGTDFGYLVYASKDLLNIEGSAVSVYSLDGGNVTCLGVFENVSLS